MVSALDPSLSVSSEERNRLPVRPFLDNHSSIPMTSTSEIDASARHVLVNSADFSSIRTRAAEPLAVRCQRNGVMGCFADVDSTEDVVDRFAHVDTPFRLSALTVTAPLPVTHVMQTPRCSFGHASISGEPVPSDPAASLDETCNRPVGV